MTASFSSAAPFCTSIPVRFGDCDPAGIVFYPRYFEMFNSIVEDWCDQGLGMSFREMHLKHGIGVPTVHIETDFIAPSELGDLLQAQLTVDRIGGASMHVAIRLFGPDGTARVRASIVLVTMNLHERRAIPLPDDMRGRASAFCVTDIKTE
jgi:4-hydroxybenzoyl-CoA thioesterase